MKTLKSHLVCFALLSILSMQFSNAQIAYQWQKAYGGSLNDGAYSISTTNDGGTIVGGYSYSGISGIKTESAYGLGDYWVLKLDADGNKKKKKTYGGSGLDVLVQVVQTADGGYFVGGYSQSPISGNKTENSIAGTPDIWLLRIDGVGNILWQTDLGGNGTDYLGDVNETSDGGCIIGGYSNSSNSGDKTENSKGNLDYWIIKLNSDGSIGWQNTIGGTSIDQCHAAEQLPDGTYFISGYSSSPISFDKTEAPVGPFNNYDAWIMQLNASGSIIWQNVIGGSSVENLYAAKITPDNGAILAIQSNSNISGDKTENTISGVVGDMDYWLVKVDHLGNVEWENTLGGIHADLCYDVVLTTSGGYAVAGHSLSGVSGDKTNANWGDTYDYWAVGVDSLGLVIWDKTYGGLNEDYGYAMSGNENGQFIIAGNSASGISGDRTEASYGVYDFWLIKFRPVCDSTGEVCNTLDDDCDGLIDESVIEDIYIYNLGETSVCQGAGVTMFAEYTGASVQWTRNGIPLPGATGPGYVALASGNYACITTSDCGEATSNAIHVTINKKPKAKVVAGGPTTFCDGDFVYLNELPTAGCTYLWQKDGTSIPGAVLNTYVATTTGNYRCIVTKTETGCFNTSNSIIVTVDCKVGEIQTLELSIYPNPASSNITIKTNNTDPKTISIFNAVGALVYNTLSVEENVLVAINHLPAGVYYVDMAAEYGKGNCTFVKE